MLSFTPQVDKENLWFGIIPRISFADKETYVESETKQYDMVSSKMLPFLSFWNCLGVTLTFNSIRKVE